MDISNNYWNFVEEIIATPVTILKEQADFLTKTTKGILVGEISFEKEERNVNPNFLNLRKSTLASAALNIKSPILSYTYELLAIDYNIKDGYPVNIYFDDKYYEIKNEAEFKEKIQEILKSETSKKIIQNLYSQSKAFEKKYKTDGLDV